MEIINRQVNLNTLSALKENIKAALENGGIDTSKIRAFLEQNIDPQRLLESPIDYGMIAVAFPELQPLIAYKKDMTPENVLDHVLASASFPGFQPTVIGDKKYLDGGLYDACPYNELLDYGCDEVIAIRLNGFGIIHPLRDKEKIRQNFPSEPLGPIMRFDPVTSRRNIQMGYYDTMRFMRELPGQLYYFSEKADGFAAFAALPENAIKAAGIPLRLPEGLCGELLYALLADGAVIEAARADAQALLEVDPNLEEPDHVALAREVRLAFAHESAIVGG